MDQQTPNMRQSVKRRINMEEDNEDGQRLPGPVLFNTFGIPAWLHVRICRLLQHHLQQNTDGVTAMEQHSER